VQLRLTAQLPSAHLATGFAQYPGADLDDTAGLLQHRDELLRRHQALVLAPAQQRLDTEQLGRIAVETADRLVVQFELAAPQRLAERRLQLQTAAHRHLQILAVAGELRLAGLLGAVQGQIGGAQGVQSLAVLAQRGDANAGTDHQGALVQFQWLVQLFEDALCHPLGVADAGHAVEQHDELVAAEAEQLVAGAQAAVETLRHFHQHAVADGVAEAVVDQLEAVQVDEQQRRLSWNAAVLALQEALQLLVEARAV